MKAPDRERRSQRFFWTLILVLLLGYVAVKSYHVMLAMSVYQGQTLQTDTRGAAK